MVIGRSLFIRVSIAFSGSRIEPLVDTITSGELAVLK